MKNQYFLSAGLFFILFVSTAAAQNPKNYLGIKAGISIPNLKAGGSQQNPINTGYASRLGPDFMIFYQKAITKTFFFTPGVEFSSQGGKKDGFQAFTTPDNYAAFFPPGQAPPYLYASYNSEAKMNYILLNALVSFNRPYNSKSPFTFYIDMGPFAACLISAHQVTSGSSVIYADQQKQQPLTPGPQSFDNKQDIKPDLHKGNFGIEGDLGMALSLKKGRIFLEGGANYGFLNIQKGAENGKNQTGAAIIRTGYAYGFGK